MKLTFTEQECTWLSAMVAALAVLAGRDFKRDPGVARTAHKMKYKFSGRPNYVWLGRKERELLESAANYRLAKLESTAEGVLTKEVETLRPLVTKLKETL
jgi:hypothetical protein